MRTALRGSDVFGEIRGRAAMALDMIAEVITRVSWLAAEATGELAELDDHPHLLHADPMAVTDVDALAILTVPRYEAPSTVNSNGDTTYAVPHRTRNTTRTNHRPAQHRTQHAHNPE